MRLRRQRAGYESLVLTRATWAAAEPMQIMTYRAVQATGAYATVRVTPERSSCVSSRCCWLPPGFSAGAGGWKPCCSGKHCLAGSPRWRCSLRHPTMSWPRACLSRWPPQWRPRMFRRPSCSRSAKHSMPCAGAAVSNTARQARPGADLGFARQPPAGRRLRSAGSPNAHIWPAAPAGRVTRRDGLPGGEVTRSCAWRGRLGCVFAGSPRPNRPRGHRRSQIGHPESATTGHAIGRAGYYTRWHAEGRQKCGSRGCCAALTGAGPTSTAASLAGAGSPTTSPAASVRARSGSRSCAVATSGAAWATRIAGHRAPTARRAQPGSPRSSAR